MGLVEEASVLYYRVQDYSLSDWTDRHAMRLWHLWAVVRPDPAARVTGC